MATAIANAIGTVFRKAYNAGVAYFLLKEDGDFLLKEDGDKIIL